MKRFVRNTVLSCAVAATAIAPMSAAYAGQNDDILAAGAAILSVIAEPEPRTLLDRDLNDGIDPYEALGYLPPAAHDDRQAQFVEPTPPNNWDINDRGWFKYCDDMYRWGKSRGGKMSCSVE